MENDVVLVKKSNRLKSLVCFAFLGKFMCKKLRRVEPDGLFVEGFDPNSVDSRLFGAVPFDSYLGYPLAIIYPLKRIRLL